MVDWGNPRAVIDLSYAIMDAVSTYQQHPQKPDRQPLKENPHYCRFKGDPKFEQLLENLCESATCPLQRVVENGCDCLYLDSYDVNSFIASLEADDENPYTWD
ncbi:hypothetical protein [Salinigranum sp. GCM10025319]|uniref:hypothetical protein n=1 Tax=Salinigranum sp. GCM10025319 TaxID=3252687 RepID=UPI003620415E